MDIRIDRTGPVPVYRQITAHLRTMIRSGLLPPGAKLPPERKLADTLAVNRTTVLNAYQELKSEGLVRSVMGSGTVVQERNRWIAAPDLKPSIASPSYPAGGRQPTGSIVEELLALPSDPDHISLAVGKPPADCIPLQWIKQIQAELIETCGDALFQHCPTEGDRSLRESIGGWMQKRGVSGCSGAEVMVVSGAQQGLDLVARTFIEPGDVVLVEQPTYFTAVQLFQLYGAKLIAIPSDGEGQLPLDVLESMLLKYRPKLIYVQPTFQNPTGRVWTQEQRQRFMELAERGHTMIVEEDPYFELRYEGETVPPLKAFDRAGLVIYVGTFSKLLYPGMRIGWVCAPPEAMTAMIRWKQVMDLHSNHLAQTVTNELIRSGKLEMHLTKCKEVYAAKRDWMMQAIETYAKEELCCSIPQGGYYLWVQLPETVSSTVLLMHALDENVSFVPGSHFSMNDPMATSSYIRLNFTRPSHDQIEQGIRLLGQAVRRLRHRRPRGDSFRQSLPLV